MRNTARWIVHGLAQILMLPLLAMYGMLVLVIDRDEVLRVFSQLISVLPGIPGCYLRSAFYRWVLDEFHPNARIEFGTLFSKTGARIGENVYVGPYCLLGLVTLKRDTLLGPNVQIPSGPHTHGMASLQAPIRLQPGSPRRVTIGEDCWVGGQTVILADVGPQTVVGAGSVVARELPARSVAMGNPAKVSRMRTDAASQAVSRPHVVAREFAVEHDHVNTAAD